MTTPGSINTTAAFHMSSAQTPPPCPAWRHRQVNIIREVNSTVPRGCAQAVPSTRRNRSRQPPWRQPRGKWMVSSVTSHTNATRIGWHVWEIDLKFPLYSTPGWRWRAACAQVPLPVIEGLLSQLRQQVNISGLRSTRQHQHHCRAKRGYRKCVEVFNLQARNRIGS